MRKEISRQEEEKKGNEKEGDQERDSLKRAKRRRRGKKGESGGTEIKFNSVKSPLHLPSAAPSATPPSFPPVEEKRKPVGFFQAGRQTGRGKGENLGFIQRCCDN